MTAKISYSDFFDATYDGVPMNNTNAPEIWGEHNISWPKGWTPAMADAYRRKHGLVSPRKDMFKRPAKYICAGNYADPQIFDYSLHDEKQYRRAFWLTIVALYALAGWGLLWILGLR